MRLISKGIAVVLVLPCALGTLRAQDQTASSISREVRDIFDRARHAVVKIHGVDDHSDFYGTGFFIDPTGTLYTAYTVGGEAGNFTIEFDGKKYPARQVLADVRSGMAILKMDAATPALPIGKSEQLEIATPVVTVGFPLDLPQSPNFGMIAGFDRKYLGRYFSTTHLRVNLPTQRGEAGAPVLNFKGEVVGIVVSSLENTSSCYALPIEAAEKIRSDFVRFGEVRHGWVGANVSAAKTATEGSRAEVVDITDHPASEGGLQQGDILLQVGKTKVREPEDVLDASFFLTAGDTIPITVVRNGEKVTLNVQPDMHPASKNLPMYPDGRRPAMSATFTPNRAIPMNLQSAPERTP
ncbi:MAG TPA: trypsin-like peptidase domain-containing protein [Verrucomicrobiae bacterium]|nr:trypsin-like peptidase domain-containing protein [Verrucomicrobiae bacterium]